MPNLTTIDRLFYCKCAGYNYNLDLRDLVVHFATNDRSLLTKLRKRAHAYILRLHGASGDAGTFKFVYYNTPPSPGSTSTSATISNATSRAIEGRVANEKRSKPSLLYRFVTANEYERANVEPPDATGPDPLLPVSQTPHRSLPYPWTHGPSADVELLAPATLRLSPRVFRLTFILTPPNFNGQHSTRKGPVRRSRL